MRPNVNIASEGREKEVIVVIFTHCLLNPLPLTESQNFESKANSISVGKDAENRDYVKRGSTGKRERISEVTGFEPHTSSVSVLPEFNNRISKLYKIES